MAQGRNIVNVFDSIFVDEVLSVPKSFELETVKVETLNLYVEVVGKIGDKVTVIFETSPDKTLWAQTTSNIDADTGDTEVLKRTFEYTLTSATDTFQIPLNLQDNYVRVKLSCDNTSAVATAIVTTIR